MPRPVGSHIVARNNLFPSSQFGGIPGRFMEDTLICTIHDIETAWNHKHKASILTFDITGFFDTIPHAHLLKTLHEYHLPLPVTCWVHSFLKDCCAAICLDGKCDELHLIETRVPQGSCVSPILAAYFTSPMVGEVHKRTNKCIADSTELSTLANEGKVTLSPMTLYVDDGVILTSRPSLVTTAWVTTMAFEETHSWLSQRGMRTDQVKNELMHFMKSKNQDSNPSIHIPAINPGELKEVTPVKCMRYLSLWFDPQLKFHEHAKIVASKASRAIEALCMLGNSTSTINQHCLRQFYLGAVLPIVMYGSAAFWDGKSSTIKNTLECIQNKVLCLITRAFKMTPIQALKIESSIPPINITLNYYTEHYAT